ncbi:MAG: hypothetical protein QOC70_149 [Verrucomicrobiota bacterium]|jgi:hypothetical protein
MKKRIVKTATLSLTVLFAAASMSFAKPQAKASPAAAKSDATKPSAESPAAAAANTSAATAPAPDAEMMKQMMELSKPGENHKLLASLAGTWTYTVKMWMNPDPKAPPMTSAGVGVRKPIMDGRYFDFEVTGKMKMPGADGKMKDTEFKGMSLEGYDNVKKKFVSTWCDNMGTGIFMSEGTYDAASKTFTYTGESEMIPGTKTKIREVIKVVDNDH